MVSTAIFALSPTTLGFITKKVWNKRERHRGKKKISYQVFKDYLYKREKIIYEEVTNNKRKHIFLKGNVKNVSPDLWLLMFFKQIWNITYSKPDNYKSNMEVKRRRVVRKMALLEKRLVFKKCRENILKNWTSEKLWKIYYRTFQIFTIYKAHFIHWWNKLNSRQR